MACRACGSGCLRHAKCVRAGSDEPDDHRDPSGIVLCNLMSLPKEVERGLQLAGKGLLRGAAALLGLQVTFGQLAALGPWSLASAVLVVASTFLVMLGLGKFLRVPMPLASLIGAGTAVCGASAIAGVNGALLARQLASRYLAAQRRA
ncbi:putative sulfate exporter family transporter [Aerobium aerolatum]|uniref:putative sulfate exporter family transporter n=1 Tax=Aerobium aerolatum TaxID=561088 RepID=UPI000B84D5BB|nr:putative sulfate exporter family transporter [Aquamicrobium aerolatum]